MATTPVTLVSLHRATDQGVGYGAWAEEPQSQQQSHNRGAAQ